MPKITGIEGIGAKNAEKLKTVGITTTEALLDKGATAKSQTSRGRSHPLWSRAGG